VGERATGAVDGHRPVAREAYRQAALRACDPWPGLGRVVEAFAARGRRPDDRDLGLARDHSSKEVQALVAGHRDRIIDWLPPYAPDPNPAVGRHSSAVQEMKDAIPESVDEMRGHADRGFARLRRRPDLVLAPSAVRGTE
jgi:hypothetical protein